MCSHLWFDHNILLYGSKFAALTHVTLRINNTSYVPLGKLCIVVIQLKTKRQISNNLLLWKLS